MLIENKNTILTLEFSGYEFSDQMLVKTETQSIEINNDGNLPSPAVLEIIPKTSGTLAIAGCTTEPFTVKNVTEGQKIIISGITGEMTADGESKAADMEIWELPHLLPGSNVVSLNLQADVTIKYEARYFKKKEEKMRIKNKEIRILAEKMKEIEKKNFPVKVSFVLARNQKTIADILQTLEGQRKKLCEKYAERDENGNIKTEDNAYVIRDVQSLKKEYQELLEIETELELQKIEEADLEKCGEGKYDAISPDDAHFFQYMI